MIISMYCPSCHKESKYLAKGVCEHCGETKKFAVILRQISWGIIIAVLLYWGLVLLADNAEAVEKTSGYVAGRSVTLVSKPSRNGKVITRGYVGNKPVRLKTRQSRGRTVTTGYVGGKSVRLTKKD